MANTAVITSIQYMLREEIGPTVIDMLPQIDPAAFDKMDITSEGVARLADISRGWLMRLTCSSGLAGALKWVDPNVDYVTTSTSKYHTHATKLPTNRFPSAANLPLKSIVQITVPLAKAMGNCAWPLEYMRAEKMTAAIAKYTQLNLDAMGRMIALAQANSFFAPTTGVIAQVNGTPSSTGDSDGIITCSVDNGRVHQFQDGMLVDIYTDDGSTWSQANVSGGVATQCVVDGVNYLGETNELRLVCDGVLDDAIADGDYFIAKDSYDDATKDYARKGPLGLEDMIKAAATGAQYVMSPNNSASYGFNLDKYPNFGSKVATSVGVLDEDTFNKYVGQFFDATGLTLDTAITTRGVINKLYEYPTLDSGRQVTDRTGQVRKFRMGRGELEVSYEGQDLQVMRSRFCAPGTLYAVQKAGNFSMAVPPRQPGTTSKGTRYGAPIEFVGKALGHTGDFFGVTSGDAPTEMVQSPFVLYYQIVCEKPQGVKLSGITED